jgi:hypothetical protein
VWDGYEMDRLDGSDWCRGKPRSRERICDAVLAAAGERMEIGRHTIKLRMTCGGDSKYDKRGRLKVVAGRPSKG